jgi:AraC-like DNA-binding protein
MLYLQQFHRFAPIGHAARLLRRRALTSTRQPISEIAYACGFNDYSYFSQKFHRRFGFTPSAHAGNSHGVKS